MAERASLQPETRRAPAYDPQFDINTYRKLEGLRFQVAVDEYHRLKDQFATRTRHNLETALGERFNVQISEVYYRIENNQLINWEHDEPFIEVVKRGVQYRRANGNPYDHEREQAELEGFLKIQKILTQPHIACGMNVISISPRGSQKSDYKLNFFDIYSVIDTNEIRMSRFASKMSYEEFLDTAKSINPSLEQPQKLNGCFFLANPIETFRSFEEILEIFHPDLDAMTQEKYRKLIEESTPLITAHIQALTTDDRVLTYKTYNALLNFSDRTARILSGSDSKSDYWTKPFEIAQVIDYFGKLPVHQVAAGCGLQAGFLPTTNYPTIQLPNYYPYSVSEFGAKGCDDCGGSDGHFHCPECNGQIKSGSGITTCPHCGLTKEQAGSKCT